MSAAEVSTITQIIANLGFPIAAFLLLYRFIDKTLQENTKALQAVQSAVTELCAKMEEKNDA